jgi:hypothetical protein
MSLFLMSMMIDGADDCRWPYVVWGQAAANPGQRTDFAVWQFDACHTSGTGVLVRRPLRHRNAHTLWGAQTEEPPT